jgi:hypothetical protein
MKGDTIYLTTISRQLAQYIIDIASDKIGHNQPDDTQHNDYGDDDFKFPVHFQTHAKNLSSKLNSYADEKVSARFFAGRFSL